MNMSATTLNILFDDSDDGLPTKCMICVQVLQSYLDKNEAPEREAIELTIELIEALYGRLAPTSANEGS